jgi:hypothetical protein
MNDVGKWLRDADPLAPGSLDVGFTPADAQTVRRAMLAALGERRADAWLWPRPLAIAATVALTLASGVVLGRHLPSLRDAAGQLPTHAGGVPVAEVRQLQFATPGGTRVIWVFNPEFQP